MNSVGVESPLGLMSAPTLLVPAPVPSLAQSSRPFVPSSALKKMSEPALKKLPGVELPVPGLMSRSGVVPAVVPSLFHSSEPKLPSLAVKSSRLPIAVRLVGWDEGFGTPTAGAGKMSLTSTVPAVVPSLFQSSRLMTLSFAVKYSRLPTAVSSAGSEPRPVPTRMSWTREAPAPGFERSSLYSSRPSAPVEAVKNNVLPTTVRSFTRAPAPKLVTLTVPLVVPSLRQTSRLSACPVNPVLMSFAVK